MKIANCPICDSFPTHHTDVGSPSAWRMWVGCTNRDCLQGPMRVSQAEAIMVWNRLARAVKVHAAAEAWQQAIATVNGVHAAEQALLAALKELD